MPVRRAVPSKSRLPTSCIRSRRWRSRPGTTNILMPPNSPRRLSGLWSSAGAVLRPGWRHAITCSTIPQQMVKLGMMGMGMLRRNRLPLRPKSIREVDQLAGDSGRSQSDRRRRSGTHDCEILSLLSRLLAAASVAMPTRSQPGCRARPSALNWSRWMTGTAAGPPSIFRSTGCPPMPWWRAIWRGQSSTAQRNWWCRAARVF